MPKHTNLIKAAALGAALALPMSAFALMSDDEAQQAVKEAIMDSMSGDAIIQMLRDDGRSLEEATLIAVAAAAGPSQVTMAKAGICATADKSDAEALGTSVLGIVNEGQAASQIQTIVETYETTGCDPEPGKRPPPGYTPSNTGLGGGSNLREPGSPSS